MAGDKETVVITGGNGFVGQHIIKLLHQNCEKEVKEIRAFDIVPYTQRLGGLTKWYVVLILKNRNFNRSALTLDTLWGQC